MLKLLCQLVTIHFTVALTFRKAYFIITAALTVQRMKQIVKWGKKRQNKQCYFRHCCVLACPLSVYIPPWMPLIIAYLCFRPHPIADQRLVQWAQPCRTGNEKEALHLISNWVWDFKVLLTVGWRGDVRIGPIHKMHSIRPYLIWDDKYVCVCLRNFCKRRI